MLSFVCAMALGGVASGEDTLDLSFGLYQTDKPTVLYARFVPFLDRLGTDLGAILGRNVEIKLSLYRTYDQGIDALVAGEVDFVRFGPASYVTAESRDPKIELVAMEEVDGKKTFEGVIVVRRNSSIQRLEDLAHHSFAFGDENSTIGRYLSQAELAAHGVLAADLTHYEYLGRHDLVASRVKVGDFDAGALKPDSLKKEDPEGKELRILHRFDNVTKPWIARSGLDAKVVSALTRALIGMDDEAILDAFKVSGFTRATPEDFEPVRKGMKASEDWLRPRQR